MIKVVTKFVRHQELEMDFIKRFSFIVYHRRDGALEIRVAAGICLQTGHFLSG